MPLARTLLNIWQRYFKKMFLVALKAGAGLKKIKQLRVPAIDRD